MNEERISFLKRRDRFLLGRRPLVIPDAFPKFQRILILGGAGSIGMAIARMVLNHDPDDPQNTVILADINEEGLWKAQTQDFDGYPNIKFAVADIGSPDHLAAVRDTYRPTSVINAAALKHVGFAEESPRPYSLVNFLAVGYIIIEFDGLPIVQISTDKTARPRAHMAKTKAQGEELALKNKCAVVRFGNVLGSSGSLLRTWDYRRANKMRIHAHHAQRFMMTEIEAAKLALYTLANAREFGGDVIAPILAPIAISDLAVRYCKFHGYPVDMITKVDLRAGDQFSESMVAKDEIATPTHDTDLMRITKRE